MHEPRPQTTNGLFVALIIGLGALLSACQQTPPSTTITIAVNPNQAELAPSETRGFAAATTGTSNTAVTWTTTCGTITGTTTTITYTAPTTEGTCTLTATSTADPSKNATATITIAQTEPDDILVTIEPPTAQLAQGQAQSFAATVTGTTDTTVTWTTTCGDIQGDGPTISYTAPTTDGTCELTATSTADPSKIATATITIDAIGISIEPSNLEAFFNQTRPIKATVAGTTDTNVTWALTSTCGTISGTGTTIEYTAPTSFPPSRCAITATSNADPNKQATLAISLYAPPRVTLTAAPATVALDEELIFSWTLTNPSKTLPLTCELFVLGSGTTPTYTIDDCGRRSSRSAQSHAYIGTGDYVASLTVRQGDLPLNSVGVSVVVEPPALRWAHQFGTDGDDYARGIATDTNGNVYTTGYTRGDLVGTNAGGRDAFIRSYDSNGRHRWTHQIGTDGDDYARGIATDANGNVYTTGNTRGDLEGTNAGGRDAFIRSYDSDGTLRWTRQFGTANDDVALGIATDASGNVYTTGYTDGALEGSNAGGWDAFIRSYDSNGTHRWTHQFGTNLDDYARGIATDANGNVYTTGYTNGDLDGPNAGGADAFISSFDSNGTHRWTHQLGTSRNDRANGIATDTNGNVYTTGYTFGDLDGPNAGGAGAFIVSYDSDGVLRWTHQFGTSRNDEARGIATDTNGNVYATGNTRGDLEGPNAGKRDAFIRSYDSDGTHRWTRQFGTNDNDEAFGIATDANGNVYTTGETFGDLEGPNAGGFDAFIRSYGP